MTYLLKLCTISLDNGAKICVPYSWTVLERLLILIVGMLMGVLFWYFTFRRIKGSPSLRDSVRAESFFTLIEIFLYLIATNFC